MLTVRLPNSKVGVQSIGRLDRKGGCDSFAHLVPVEPNGTSGNAYDSNHERRRIEFHHERAVPIVKSVSQPKKSDCEIGDKLRSSRRVACCEKSQTRQSKATPVTREL